MDAPPQPQPQRSLEETSVEALADAGLCCGFFVAVVDASGTRLP